MTTVLVIILLVLITVLWRLGDVIDHLKNIERLLQGEITRQHEERLAEDGRDSQGRFLKGR
jgi:hypothetical protein